GRERRVLRIKGSGSDLATCEPRDFPGLWLDDLLALRDRETMTDEEMVSYLARCLVEPDAPRPSIETLLHAFLPAAYVDHVRADADEIAAMRSTPDHMLGIGARTGGDGPVFLAPGLGCVAAGPNERTAKQRLEIAAHTHASVAATRDRFGGASWLTEDEVRDFVEWPLELYKLMLAPKPPELEGHVAIVTG